MATGQEAPDSAWGGLHVEEVGLPTAAAGGDFLCLIYPYPADDGVAHPPPTSSTNAKPNRRSHVKSDISFSLSFVHTIVALVMRVVMVGNPTLCLDVTRARVLQSIFSFVGIRSYQQRWRSGPQACAQLPIQSFGNCKFLFLLR